VLLTFYRPESLELTNLADVISVTVSNSGKFDTTVLTYARIRLRFSQAGAGERRRRWACALASAGSGETDLFLPAIYNGAVQDPRIQLLDSQLFQSLIEQAYRSPRLRTNHNFHRGMDDNPHRFLNVMVRGTYIAPHRHQNPPKAESFLVLDGEVAFFTFDDSGQITSTHVLGRDVVGIDIQPGVWHTLAAVTPHAVCYEVKPGPYSATNDKDFAPWAPREGDPDTPQYLEGLLSGIERL